jgi:isoleucyl-tRNA synthetase
MYEAVVGNNFPFTKNIENTNSSDNWIISRLNTSIRRIREFMLKYEFSHYVDEMYDFIEDYTNWYLKFNRSRLKGKESNIEWITSLNVCIYIVNVFNCLVAPITPFLSHTICSNMKKYHISYYDQESILLENFPDVKQNLVDSVGERRFKLFQKVAEGIRSLRSQIGLGSVKIPISNVRIYTDNIDDLESMREYFNSDEINVLNLEILSQITPQYSISINPSYGKQYRSDFVKIKNELVHTKIEQLGDNASIVICGYSIPREQLTITKRSSLTISSNEVLLEKDGMSIILDKTQDIDVKMRHFIRMLIYNTQRIRKTSGVRPWNKINFYYNTTNVQLNEWLNENK